MNAIVRTTSRDLTQYDPARGLKEIIVAEAAERHWKRAKDPTQLYIAIEAKIRGQADYVVWRDSVVPPTGFKDGKRFRSETLPAADPGRLTVHRWRKAFCKTIDDLDDDGKLRKTTFPDEDKIALELDDATRRCARLIEKDNNGLDDGQNQGDEWGTPVEIIERVRAFFGGQIDCDPATNEVAQKVVRATQYYTKEQDGLKQQWPGNTFLNGPYSDMAPWVKKLISEYAAGHATEAICLTNACVDTAWFRDLANVAAAICFPLGRIKFIDSNGQAPNSPTLPQALTYFGPRPCQFARPFSLIGFVVDPMRYRKGTSQ
jgi:phage N-6-adenine-methyltransferase